jgi:hypothetical protein
VIFNKPEKRTRKTLAEKNKNELIEVLDGVFSEYIRMRDADDNGYCRCISCGKYYHFRDLHCGHFISRQNEAVRYNEVNNNSQCVSCNSFKQGMWFEYEQALIEKYGKDEVEKLKNIAKLGGKLDAWLLQEMIVEYRAKVRELKKEKGL